MYLSCSNFVQFSTRIQFSPLFLSLIHFLLFLTRLLLVSFGLHFAALRFLYLISKISFYLNKLIAYANHSLSTLV